MLDSLNEVSDQIYAPAAYYRNFETDLPESRDEIQKIALLILPFIPLYQPSVGYVLSLVSGTARAYTHFNQTYEYASKRKVLATFDHFVETTLAVISVATTFFNFKIGVIITIFADASRNLSDTIIHLRAKDYPKAIEALLQISASILYLSFMLSGTTHCMLGTMLLQASISMYQAALELKKEHYPQALAKLGLGILRFKDAHNYYQTLLERYARKIEKIATIIQKIKHAQTEHLKNSPLLENKEATILTDADGKSFNFGSHYHGLGRGLVKGMNLQFRPTKIDGQNMTEIDFKINHIHREKLENWLRDLKDLTPKEVNHILSASESHALGIKIEKVPFHICSEEDAIFGRAYKISLEGLGNIFVSSSSDMPSLYNLVRVQIEENKSLEHVHEMLSFLELEDALKESSPTDIERLKIGHLFRIFYPVEATQFERQEKFFELPIDQLKQEIISQVPEMQNTIDTYLHKMDTTEILPGKLRYTVPDLAKKIYDVGARTLITTIITPDYDDKPSYKEACKRVASIFKMGMLSNETRYRNGMPTEGLSSYEDFKSGGADSVYTQLLPKRVFDKERKLEMLYEGDVRLLISLDVVNSGTYQYKDDSYGIRRTKGIFGSFYTSRPSILNFVSSEQKEFSDSNEILPKETIPAKFFTKVIVPNKKVADYQQKVFQETGLIKTINGIPTVNNIPLKDLIVVTDELTNDLLNPSIAPLTHG